MSEVRYSTWVTGTLPPVVTVDGNELLVVMQGGVPKSVPITELAGAVVSFQHQTNATPIVIGVEADDNVAPTNWQPARAFSTAALPSGDYVARYSLWWAGSRTDRASMFRCGVDGEYVPHIRTTPAMDTDIGLLHVEQVIVIPTSGQPHGMTVDVVSEEGPGAASDITISHSLLTLERRA